MISKIPVAWVKAVVEGNVLEDTFSSAWSTIINALRGSWGSLTYDALPDEELTVQVVQSRYSGVLQTTTEGAVNIKLPVNSVGYSHVKVQDIGSHVVTQTAEYVIAEGSTNLDITLYTGLKLISISGTARRL